MSRKYRKVLVTGGAGCIGMQVCKELSRHGISVCLFDLHEQVLCVKEFIPPGIDIHYGSVLDCSSLRDAMINCDAVVHLAAYLGVRRTEINALRCIEININGTKNVLDCAIQHKVRKIAFASSSEVYGEPLENPITEESLTQGKSVYAVSKLAGEELCKAYSQRYPELVYTIVRFFNTYGPFQIAQFVISKFVRNIIEGKPPIIYGDGKQVRSYCYASDTAQGVVEALVNPKADGEIFNIGNSKLPTSLFELANLIIRVCGKEGKIKPEFQKEFLNTDRSHAREVFNRYCNTEKANNILNFEPKVMLEEGIRKVIEHGIISPKWATNDMDYTIDDWV